MLLLALLLAHAAIAQEFEVVSVKPNATGDHSSHSRSDQGRYNATNVSLKQIIERAYMMKDYQIEGPDWIDSVHFDVNAKLPPDLPKDQMAWGKAFSAMMQKMLADRFQLVAHRGTKTLPVYALVTTKRTKVEEVPEGPMSSNSNNTHYVGTAVNMANLAGALSVFTDRPVIDMTELKGFYNLKLDWFPEPHQAGEAPAGPALPEALEEQLGLKLEPRKAPIEILVVDRANRTPTEN